MRKESLQAFNDGVIAIVVTLVVLAIHVTGLDWPHLWPIVGHVEVNGLSFMLVAIFWRNLRALIDRLPCVSHGAAWFDLMRRLFVPSLMPLPAIALGTTPGRCRAASSSRRC